MLKLARLGDGPEIFHTLQGEGLWSGRPSVFVRLSLCNLHCVWCDTDYTWNWQGTPFPHERDSDPGYAKFRKEEQIIALAPVDAAAVVARFDCRRVVITGGEPLLQQDGLRAMIAALRAISPDYSFEMETNGTIQPDPALDGFVKHYHVSPKLANSCTPESARRRAGVLRWFANSPKAWFKFVVSTAADLGEIAAIEAAVGIPRPRVMLMPEGRSADALAANRDLVVAQCLRHGYTFTDRLHLRLFGAKRGT